MPDHEVPLVPPVVRLANDIARQFAHLGVDEAAAAVAQHVTMFWDPRMRADLAAEIERDHTQLDPLVVAAFTSPSPR